MTRAKPTMTPEEIENWEKNPYRAINAVPPPPPTHNSTGYYSYGCRCLVCLSHSTHRKRRAAK